MSDTKNYINNRWELDAERHRGLGIQKKQFAFQIWREDLKKSKKREDDKDSEIKGNWTEIYQLIGFDNVFQGVWFQGVTQLAEHRECHFSIIPIILSVLVSLATIVGVHLKISQVRKLERSLYKDRLCSKVLQSFISECEREGLNFDVDAIGDSDENCHSFMKSDFDEETVASGYKRTILLVVLIIASCLFAWLIYLIMCDKYV